MGETVVNFLGIGLDGNSDDVGGGAAGMGDGIAHGGEHFEKVDGGLFSGFDAWLVIGVDVDEAGVKRDGAFEQGDEHANGVGGGLFDAEGDGFAVAVEKRFAGAAEETLKVVAGGGVGVDFDLGLIGALANFDEGGEEVVHPIA